MGDESVVTKAGPATYGLGRFFSSLFKRTVPGLSFFSLSLVGVKAGASYPLLVEQGVPEKKPASAAPPKAPHARPDTAEPKRHAGRPKGRQNKDKTAIKWTPELRRLERLARQVLGLIGGLFPVAYLVLDGHFGTNNVVQVVRQSLGLQLISKLRHDSALFFPYDGPQKQYGPRRSYGVKLNYRVIADQYRVASTQEQKSRPDIYQATLVHQGFAQPLNGVMLVKTNRQTGARAHVVLFSTDLSLSYALIIHYDRLRFQIEIVCTQMTKAGDRPGWTDRDDITDFNLLIVDHDPVNQQFDELATLGEVQLVQGRLESLAEVLNIDGERGQINLFLRLCIQLTELLLQSAEGLGQFMTFTFKFTSADDFGQIDFKQSLLLSLELGNRLAQDLTTGLKCLTHGSLKIRAE